MFQELLNLVKEQAGAAVIDNPAVPNEKNEAVCETATSSIIDKLKEISGSGGIDKIISMFKGENNAADHPEISNISSGVAGELMKKVGFDSATAGNIVSQLIPNVMSKLTSKTNDPDDDSFTMDGIMETLSEKGSGFLNAVKGFFGSK
jgi:uncharacterized protein YidB (DUF937 family)